MRKLKIAILFTPHTPRCVFFIARAIVAITTFCTISLAQSPAQHFVLDSLPNYELSYQRYLQKKWKADRTEFVVTTKKKWWYYLPGMGLAFGLPTVSANTGTIAQIDRDRSVMAARLLSLDERYQVEFTETLARIRTEYRKILVQHEQLERERLSLKRLHGIAQIHAEAFNTQKMSPEESLRHAYEYDLAVNAHKRRESELIIQLLEFQNLCRYQLPDKQLVPIATYDCIMEDDEAMKPQQPTFTIQAYPSKPRE